MSTDRALVLGGGGPAGIAWETGVLFGLSEAGRRRHQRVWDLATGAPIGAPFTGHTDAVFAVATAQLDGRPVVISGSFDGTVRTWDLAARAVPKPTASSS